MQTGLIIIGTLAVVAALVFSGFAFNPVVYCLLAWSVLWLGIWQAKRMHITAGNEAQARTTDSATRFWLIRLSVLLLSLVLGLGAYTQFLVRTYELPTEYQWQAMAWELGINRPTPTLIEIPAGSFEMGSEIYDTEKPVHRVTIPESFQMGDSEVTFAQYDYYVWRMKRAGFDDLSYPSDSDWGRAKRPVINVDWDEAQGYVNWLSKENQQKLSCRLPSEVEWEYAARAGTTTDYYWGNDSEGKAREHANFSGTKGSDTWSSETAPVKQFKPNGFGLFDISGNVYEWVQDRWHDSYLDKDQIAPEDGSAWESGSGASRVLRGGSWNDTSNFVRSAYRSSLGLGNYVIGFRVVCSPIDH